MDSKLAAVISLIFPKQNAKILKSLFINSHLKYLFDRKITVHKYRHNTVKMNIYFLS